MDLAGLLCYHNARKPSIRGADKYHEILTFPKAKIVGSEVIVQKNGVFIDHSGANFGYNSIMCYWEGYYYSILLNAGAHATSGGEVKTTQVTLTLQKSRMPQILGVEGEAVVLYREPSTTQEMQYPRLSRRVNKMAVFPVFRMPPVEDSSKT
jgi:hypothetical protein